MDHSGMGHGGMDHGGMNHGDMSHGGMDHGGMGHGGMDHGQCSMNMIFTWDYQNMCIVFRSWRVTSVTSLIMSILAIVVLCAGYEALREASRRYDVMLARKAAQNQDVPTSQVYRDSTAQSEDNDPDGSSLLYSGPSTRDGGLDKPATLRNGHGRADAAKTVKAIFYALQVFYSFFIMLLFMTYNGWIMLAVAVGAFVGHFAFSSPGVPSAKSAACH